MQTALNIASVKAIGVEAKMDCTFYEARNLIHNEKTIIVTLATVGGDIGLATVSAADTKATIRALELFGEYVAGSHALDTSAVWQAMTAVTAMAPGVVAGQPLLAALKALPETALLAAIAGIDLALWDVKGKILEQPVWRLAGGYSNGIDCYATGGYYRIGQADHDPARQLEMFMRQGYTAFKMKLGALGLEADAARLASARRTVGDTARLMIDANRSYTLRQAKDAIARFEAYAPYWYEEPLLFSETLHALRALSDFTRVPLAYGESEVHMATCCDQIRVGGVQVMQFDATRFGGATGWLALAAYAGFSGARMATHHNWHIHAHLAAAVPNGEYVEVHSDPERNVLAPRIIKGNPPVVNGRITLDETPGFGFEIDWKEAERLRIA
jgi:L-alanine-DL-glutamate epimerase-like enolase superfamily enzyme